MSTSLVEIKTGLNVTDSHMLLVRLQSQGIPAQLIDVNSSNAMPYYNIPQLGIGPKILVPREHAQKTHKIIQTYYNRQNIKRKERAGKCPRCKSENIKMSLRLVAMNLLYLLTFQYQKIDTSYSHVCNNCEYRW